ncbi:MAG: polyprenyl synthetase family protein [Rhodobacteraceae bacterium]|jgi:octaprenyl-diphosphate synthase|nr:polyprenyl synthetase family protein [Paracoccaceae bacterium]
MGEYYAAHLQESRRAIGATLLKELNHKPHDQLAEILAPEMARVDALIRERMRSENAPRIPEVTAHLVNAGGKRLRPLLTLATAALCGYKGPYHIHLAATVEFIHTATLLHDDVVDESGQRRGRPTANLLWDNKSSILVGDYLFSRAFQLMVETNSLRVLDILANASATIAEGEVLQLTAAQDISTSEDTYLKVVRGKTAALFSAATEVGGVIAGASQVHVESLYCYGDALGIAFQIVDDLLDVTGDSEKTGKNIGDDFRERKLTLPFIKAIAKATEEERRFWIRTIEKGEQIDGDLEQALSLLQSHGAIEATRKDAMEWAQKAQDSLSNLPEHPLRTLLSNLSVYVVERLT